MRGEGQLSLLRVFVEGELLSQITGLILYVENSEFE